MNILLAGASGQLGQELYTQLARMGHITGVDRLVGQEGAIKQDLTELGQVEAMLDRLQPDLVVNAAAYTAVDQAENEPSIAFGLNAELPGCLARWCRSNERFLLHYSTDYIFDGSAREPYKEDHRPGPLNVYGESKLAGEWAVGASGCEHVILRTSWVYSTHGSNFVLSMLKLAQQRPDLSIVSDQVGCPTWARNLAQTSSVVLQQALDNRSDAELQGIFHYCDNSVTSWYEFARLIFERATELKLLTQMPKLRSIRSADYPQVAGRPAYSVLDTRRICKKFGLQPPSLEESLKSCLKELVA